MSTTLPHGIIQINEGNISWYGDITANWQLIDSKIGEYDAAVASIPAPANNGTLTINYAGTIIAMFGADDAGNVSADIPAPGDGTLTIQQNGTTVDTFTANSSSDKTVNIQCVDLTNNQTVAGNKEFTGTTTAHDLVPSATNTYNFGSSTAQWNNAYIKSLTINGVACGDILTHNASEFVDVSTAQTIDGQKIFSHGQIGVGRDLYHFASNPYGKNTPPASTSFQYVMFAGNTASQGLTNNWYGSFIELVMNTDGSSRGSWVIRNTSDNRMGIQLSESADGSSSSITPIGSGIDLGTSTNKWKSIYSNTYYLGNTAFGNIVTHNASEFVLVSDLTSVLPVGSYIQFAGSQAPDGFLVCNGGEISRTTYSALFAVIGTTYGSGDDSTTFNLPNLTDRFLQGSTTSGTVKNAGLPNITGGFGGRFVNASDGANIITDRTGAFRKGETTGKYLGIEPRSDASNDVATDFSASQSNSIYGSSSTVQPPALTCLICIKY